MRTIHTAALALLLGAAPLAAQTPAPSPAAPEGTLIDQVVAVVGDTVILLSDVRSELLRMQQAGRPMPQDPAQLEALGQQILTSRVNDLLLVEAAQAAGMTVEDDRVNQQVEQSMREVLASFRGDEQAFTAALARDGVTREQYRQQLFAQVRDQALAQQFLAERTRNRAKPLVSEEQVRAYFDAQRASLGARPAQISFQQVIVPPQPSDSAKAAARRQAEEVIAELQKGGDFAVLARRFSDDPGSKERGGDLGWFRRGRMVAKFEEVAFALRPGETSGIVETEFGFHIIRLEKTRGPERSARHILIKPEVTPADVQRARQVADSLATLVRGGASVPALSRQYNTRSEEASVTRWRMDRLPPEYALSLSGVTTGQVVGPLEIPGQGENRFAVLKITEHLPEGEYTIDDVREQIQELLQRDKMTQDLVQELRREIHVAILR
jgi:peptidyl-prolyl cis-trans isomerase SurA